MERAWSFMRSHHLSNRVYRDCDDLFGATRNAWNYIDEARYKSLCHERWIERAN